MTDQLDTPTGVVLKGVPYIGPALHTVNTGATRVVAKGRWYAARFLEQMAEDEPEMAQDLLAAACYETGRPLLWHNWIFTWVDQGQLDAYGNGIS